MHSDKIQVVDVDTSNIDDLVSVCSFKKLDNPIHKMGIDLKTEWIKDMLQTYGPCAKIAYLNRIPCGQILHYAEERDPLVTKPRARAIQVQCIFTSRPEARRRGVAKALLEHLLKDVKQPMACFHNQPCSFVFTSAFDTGEVFSQRRFFEHMGFKRAVNDSDTLYYPIAGTFAPRETAESREAFSDDEGRAVLLYSPTCQFSFEFAKQAEATIGAVAPKLPIRLVDEWKHPSEAIRRKGEKILVNGVPIRSFFSGEDEFKDDIKKALATRRRLGQHISEGRFLLTELSVHLLVLPKVWEGGASTFQMPVLRRILLP